LPKNKISQRKNICEERWSTVIKNTPKAASISCVTPGAGFMKRPYDVVAGDKSPKA